MAPAQATARECRRWPKDALRTGFWTSLQHPAITVFWALAAAEGFGGPDTSGASLRAADSSHAG